jgi:hypothetical protein
MQNSQLLEFSCAFFKGSMRCDLVSSMLIGPVFEIQLRQAGAAPGLQGSSPPLSERSTTPLTLAPQGKLPNRESSSWLSMTPDTFWAVASFPVGFRRLSQASASKTPRQHLSCFPSFPLPRYLDLELRTGRFPRRICSVPSPDTAMSSSLKLTGLVYFDQKTLLSARNPELRLR